MADVPQLTGLLAEQAAHLQPWEPTRPPDYYTESRQRALAEQALAGYESGTRVPFLITAADGELVGTLNLNGVVRGALQSCAMGYWVRSDRTRQGHATAAVKDATAYAFEELGLHRVQAETLPENVGSQRVLARNGYRLFGSAPQYLRINGQWRDHLLFQKLNEDYQDTTSPLPH